MLNYLVNKLKKKKILEVTNPKITSIENNLTQKDYETLPIAKQIYKITENSKWNKEIDLELLNILNMHNKYGIYIHWGIIASFLNNSFLNNYSMKNIYLAHECKERYYILINVINPPLYFY